MVIIWILFAIASAIVAGTKGRNALGWFFLGLILPLISLIIIAVLPIVRATAADPNSKKCPFCAETIQWEAKDCRYCGKELAISKETISNDKRPCSEVWGLEKSKEKSEPTLKKLW